MRQIPARGARTGEEGLKAGLRPYGYPIGRDDVEPWLRLTAAGGRASGQANARAWRSYPRSSLRRRCPSIAVSTKLLVYLHDDSACDVIVQAALVPTEDEHDVDQAEPRAYDGNL